MKTEDYNKLKELCEANGFDVEISNAYGIVIVNKKDIWDGVEFVECLENSSDQFSRHKIYKVKEFIGSVILVCVDDSGCFTNGWDKHRFKPSNEQAYIEQLKKEAFERFGEIRYKDNFKSPIGHKYQIPSDYGFEYFKSNDILKFSGITIYQQGNWAIKLPERIRVEGKSSNGSGNVKGDDSWTYTFSFNLSRKDLTAYDMHTKVLPFLAEQLEEYLNNNK